MTRRDKLIERLRLVRSDADARDVRGALEAAGWKFVRQRGSHVTFRKPDELEFTFPLLHGRRVKAFYVREALKRVSGEEN